MTAQNPNNQYRLSSALSYARGIGSGTVSVISIAVMGFATVWFLNHSADKETFGSFTIAITVISIIELVISGIPTNILMYKISRMSGQGTGLAGVSVASPLVSIFGLMAIATGGILVLVGVAANSINSPARVEFWLLVLSPLLIFRVLRNLFTTWLRANRRVASASLIGQTTVSIATIALMALVYFVQLSEVYFGVAVVAGIAIPALYLLKSFPVSFSLNRESITAWDFRYGIKLMLNAAVGRLILNSDILFLGVMTNSIVAAEYAVASRIAFVLPTVVRSVTDVFTPRIGQMLQTGDRKGIQSEHQIVRLGLLATGLIFTIALMILGKPVLDIFGDYTASYNLLLILICAQLIPIFFGGNVSLITMAGHGGWYLVASLSVLGVNAGLNVLLIPAYGAVGAAISSAIAFGILHIIVALVIFRKEKIATFSIGVGTTLAATIIIIVLISLGYFTNLSGSVALFAVLLVFLYANRSQLDTVTQSARLIWLSFRRRS